MSGDHKYGNKYRKGLRPSNAFKEGETVGKANVKYVDPVGLVCSECKTLFFRKPWQNRRNIENSFCSKNCAQLFRAQRCGPLAKDYVGGIATYRGRNWTSQRLRAIARDRGVCQRCGKKVGLSISVHHKKPYRAYATAKQANHLSNLVSLCQSCHMKIERLPWSQSLLIFKNAVD